MSHEPKLIKASNGEWLFNKGKHAIDGNQKYKQFRLGADRSKADAKANQNDGSQLHLRVKMTGIVRAAVTELSNKQTKIEVLYPHFSDPDPEADPPHEYDWIAHYLSGVFCGDCPEKFTHVSMGSEDHGQHV